VKKALQRYGRYALALTGMIVLALAVAAYVAVHQRVVFPWQDRVSIWAEFETSQAVTPGQGQNVTVAGVDVGLIGEVKLKNGRARVKMVLDPSKLGKVYSNAHLLLRPKTGLDDMSIDLDPGTPEAGKPDQGELHDGDTLPVWNSLPNVNPDEVLAALDGDTRNYLKILADAGGQGLGDDGAFNLRKVLEASQPTLARTRRVTAAIADRRAKVRRLVHNPRLLSEATADKDTELANLVDASSVVFKTIGDRDAEVADSVRHLPGALNATRTALEQTQALATDLKPTAAELRPAVRVLAPALVRVRALLRVSAPILEYDLRPLVRQTTPLIADLRPSVKKLSPATDDLIRGVGVLNYVVNELGYNPPGPEEGYLFWLAWFTHNSNNILSVEDAHGGTWRGLIVVGCSTAGQVIDFAPVLAPLLTAPICPGTPLPTLPDLINQLPGVLGQAPIQIPPVPGDKSKKGVADSALKPVADLKQKAAGK
jgi:phospholipid/cholesterol/gamma-HCH transport system substrate-binding protein